MKLTDGINELDLESIERLLLRSKNSLLTINLLKNDPNYGDHVLVTVNDERIGHDQLEGLYEDDHPQYLDQRRHIMLHGGIIDGSGQVIIGLDDLTDVQVTDPKANQMLKFNGSYWSNAYLSHSQLVNIDDNDDHKQYLNIERHNNIQLHNYYNEATGNGNLPHDYLIKLQDVRTSGMKNGQVLVKQGDLFVPADMPTSGNPENYDDDYLRLDGTTLPTSNLNINNKRLTNIGAPINPSDAATKEMVDAIVWRKPVLAIRTTYPPNPSNGDRYAISHSAVDESIRGQIIEYQNGWKITAPYYGNAFFNIADKMPYYWNGNLFNTFGNTTPVEGFVTTDGKTPLTGDWTTGSKTIKLPNAVAFEDAATKYNVYKRFSEMSFSNPVLDLEYDAVVPYPQSVAVGDRYVASWASVPGSMPRAIFECYKIVNGVASWLVTPRTRGMVVYSLKHNRYYWCDGSNWYPLEYALDITKMNYGDITIIHGSLDDLNIETDHPQYLFTSGNNQMLSDLNVGNFRIKNVHDGVNDTDGVNLKQLMLVANGINWLAPVDTISSEPNVLNGRVIVGPDPIYEFAGHENDIATYNGSEYTFYTPSRSDACLVNDTGEQYVFNGNGWVKYLSASLHRNLADANSATNHLRYLRNDADGTETGNVTFSPISKLYPFTVPATHTARVNNLNVDRVDNRHATDVPTVPQADRLVVYTDQGDIYANEFISNESTVKDLNSSTTVYSSKFDELTCDYNIQLAYGSKKRIVSNASELWLNGTKVLTVGNIGNVDADTLDGKHADDFAEKLHTHLEEISLNDLKDVEAVDPQDNWVLTYDFVNKIWKAKTFNEISSTGHGSLAGLLNDDHPQYLTQARHQAILHQFGRELPYVKLSDISDIYNLNQASAGKVLVFDESGKLYPSSVSAENIMHSSLQQLENDDHPQYFRVDGSRPLMNSLFDFGNVVGNSTIRNRQGAVHYSIEFGDTVAAYGESLGYGFLLSCTYSGDMGIPSSVDFNCQHFRWIGRGGTGYEGVDPDPTEFLVDKSGIKYTRGTIVYKVWTEACEKNAQGALVGLNAEKLNGVTLEEILSGNAAIEAHILRDDHTNYLNETRHASVAHHISQIEEIVLTEPQFDDILYYRNGVFVNGQPGAATVHDGLTGAATSTIHQNYVRNDIDQTLTNKLTFNRTGVPFVIGASATTKVNNLNADLIDDLHSTELARLAFDNQYTKQNSFVDIRMSADGIITLPLKADATVDKEIWIGVDNHLWFRDEMGISRQVPLSVSGAINHDTTLSGDGSAGNPFSVVYGTTAGTAAEGNHTHSYIPISEKGTANGVAELGSDGKVLSSQLPSYVSSVDSVANYVALPATGQVDVIYITEDDNKTFRWSGSSYVEISQSLALGETALTAHRGDHGKIAYDHSQVAHAPSNAQKNSDITKEEIEAKLTGAITSHSHASGTPVSHATSHVTGGTDVIPNVVAGGNSGLMSGADKTKLDGLQNYSLPVATGSVLGGVKIGQNITIVDGVISVASPGGSAAASQYIQRTIPGVVNVDDVLMFWVAPAACTINSCSMHLLSAPSGSSTACWVQVMKNGVIETDSIFTSDVAMSIDNTTSAVNGIYTATGSLDSGQTTLASGDVIHFRVNRADTGSFGLLVQMKVTFT